MQQPALPRNEVVAIASTKTDVHHLEIQILFHFELTELSLA